MDTQRLEVLHQEASGHYLKGDLDAARASWTRLLDLAPNDERALEGIRLCDQLAGGEESSVCTAGHSPFAVSDAAEPAAASPESPAERIELPDEIDQALEFFGAHGDADEVAGDNDGFLDLSSLADEVSDKSAPMPFPAPPVASAPAPPVSDFGARPLHADAPAAPTNDGPGKTQDAAAMELRRRVNELLANALVYAEQDRKEEALKTLDRLLILDEENEAAQSLKSKIEDEMGIGGEADSQPEAGSELLGFEGNSAAQHDESAYDSNDITPIDLAVHAPDDAADLDVSLDAGHEFDPDAEFDPDSEFDPDAAAEPRAPAGRETPPTLSTPQKANVMVIGVVGVVVLAALVYFLLPRFIGGESAPVVDPARQAAAEIEAALQPLSVPEAALPQQAQPQEPSEPTLAEEIAAAVGEGERAMTEGDYALAVLSFDRALQLSPEDVDIRRQLTKAGDRYRERQEVERQWAEAREQFDQGSYKQALRLFYRLPATEDREKVLRYQVGGWFNLGVLALKAADCEAAVEHFAEARSLAPADAAISTAASLAASCDVQRGTAYLIQVDALQIRTIDD